ncbi:MAG TPA: hypothetical protein VMT57_05820 [Candidatus Thermoplasmatota archaeon]|nr:hypothetical protein [Candidatus Thermoplasmatota archaeon]
MSDKYLSESGYQGGKIIGEHIVFVSFIFGFSLLIVGLFSLFYLLFVTGFPEEMPLILILLSPQSLAIIIGLLSITGGYFIYRNKHSNKLA